MCGKNGGSTPTALQSQTRWYHCLWQGTEAAEGAQGAMAGPGPPPGNTPAEWGASSQACSLAARTLCIDFSPRTHTSDRHRQCPRSCPVLALGQVARRRVLLLPARIGTAVLGRHHRPWSVWVWAENKVREAPDVARRRLPYPRNAILAASVNSMPIIVMLQTTCTQPSQQPVDNGSPALHIYGDRGMPGMATSTLAHAPAVSTRYHLRFPRGRGERFCATKEFFLEHVLQHPPGPGPSHNHACASQLNTPDKTFTLQVKLGRTTYSKNASWGTVMCLSGLVLMSIPSPSGGG